MKSFIQNLIKFLKRLVPLTIKIKLKRLLYKNQRRSAPAGTNDVVRVLLIAQYPSIWVSWVSFWQACVRSPEVEVHVVLTPFVHAYATKNTYDELQSKLKQDGVPYFLSDFYNIDSFKPHVVFLQNPYDSTRPPLFDSKLLSDKGYRVAYIPYGLEMGGGKENLDWQFNLPFHQRAWRIFARSARHKTMFAKYCATGASRVVVTGHPKFDHQVESLSADMTLPASLVQKIGGRKVILWTPHFSVGLPPTWSTYRIYGEYILDQTIKYDDLFFIIRPHPLFFKAMIENKLWSDADEVAFKRRCELQANLWLDEGSDYIGMFSIADALMTDVGSFLLEFLPTGKPLLYLHHPEGLGLNDDGDLIDYLYKAESFTDIQKFIDQIKTNDDPKFSHRIQAVSEYLFGLDGKAGERICTHVITAIKTGDEENLLDSNPEELQERSVNYWSNASHTFLAPPDYYATKERILNEVLSELPILENAIDIGCGDGFFTRVIAKKIKFVEAYDVSKSLIEKANSDLKNENLINIRFSVRELDDENINGSFELASCMGVVSCILDDEKYQRVLNQLCLMIKNNGYLLMTDTLSITEEQVVLGDNGYLAKYRSEESYLMHLAGRGFTLIKSVELKRIEEKNLVNRLYLWNIRK